MIKKQFDNPQVIREEIKRLESSIENRNELLSNTQRTQKSIWHHKNLIEYESTQIEQLKNLLTTME